MFTFVVCHFFLPCFCDRPERGNCTHWCRTRPDRAGFYFQGRSATTQIRNSAAARFGSNRYVIAGLVDTSGYAADVRAKYEGFLITDSAIKINGVALGVGAYGFGFTNTGKLAILDLAD